MTRKKTQPCDREVTGLVPGWSLDGAIAAIVGTYSSSTSETTQISDGSCSTTTNILIHTEGPCPTSPVEWFYNRTGAAEAGGSDQL